MANLRAREQTRMRFGGESSWTVNANVGTFHTPAATVRATSDARRVSSIRFQATLQSRNDVSLDSAAERESSTWT